MFRIFGCTALAAAASTVVMMGLALGTPALAQPHDRDHHPPRHFHHRPPPPPPAPVYGYDVPTVVAAPPPLVYAPPAAPEIALGLSFNLR